MRLSVSNKLTILTWIILIKYHQVTAKQTDKQTDRHPDDSLYSAMCSKLVVEVK